MNNLFLPTKLLFSIKMTENEKIVLVRSMIEFNDVQL